MAREKSMISVYLEIARQGLRQNIKLLGDKGYQGVQIHPNSETPKKSTRGNNLSNADKKKNRELARIRVIGENVNCKLKVFKILSDRYRNRRKRFGLRFNLIAGLYNHELRLLQTPSV